MTTMTREISGEAFLALAAREKAGEIILERLEVVGVAGYIVTYRDAKQFHGAESRASHLETDGRRAIESPSNPRRELNLQPTAPAPGWETPW